MTTGMRLLLDITLDDDLPRPDPEALADLLLDALCQSEEMGMLVPIIQSYDACDPVDES